MAWLVYQIDSILQVTSGPYALRNFQQGLERVAKKKLESIYVRTYTAQLSIYQI